MEQHLGTGHHQFRILQLEIRAGVLEGIQQACQFLGFAFSGHPAHQFYVMPGQGVGIIAGFAQPEQLRQSHRVVGVSFQGFFQNGRDPAVTAILQVHVDIRIHPAAAVPCR